MTLASRQASLRSSARLTQPKLVDPVRNTRVEGTKRLSFAYSISLWKVRVTGYKMGSQARVYLRAERGRSAKAYGRLGAGHSSGNDEGSPKMRMDRGRTEGADAVRAERRTDAEARDAAVTELSGG
jgi:hypothetical protein